jgi:hypothetical protein
MGVNVTADVAAFRASVDRVQRTDLNRAIAIALNRTADRVLTFATRRIREQYRIQLRELRRGFSVRRAYAGKLEAEVRASGRPLNVIGFGARRTSKGITVDIKGSRKLIPGAFIATISNNNYTGVFRRTSKSRFPIKAISTVSVPGLFRREIVSESIAAAAVPAFRAELASAVRSIVLRKG